MFIKLDITVQPGPVKLIFQWYGYGSYLWGISGVCVHHINRSGLNLMIIHLEKTKRGCRSGPWSAGQEGKRETKRSRPGGTNYGRIDWLIDWLNYHISISQRSSPWSQSRNPFSKQAKKTRLGCMGLSNYASKWWSPDYSGENCGTYKRKSFPPKRAQSMKKSISKEPPL